MITSDADFFGGAEAIRKSVSSTLINHWQDSTPHSGEAQSALKILATGRLPTRGCLDRLIHERPIDIRRIMPSLVEIPQDELNRLKKRFSLMAGTAYVPSDVASRPTYRGNILEMPNVVYDQELSAYHAELDVEGIEQRNHDRLMFGCLATSALSECCEPSESASTAQRIEKMAAIRRRIKLLHLNIPSP